MLSCCLLHYYYALCTYFHFKLHFQWQHFATAMYKLARFRFMYVMYSLRISRRTALRESIKTSSVSQIARREASRRKRFNHCLRAVCIFIHMLSMFSILQFLYIRDQEEQIEKEDIFIYFYLILRAFVQCKMISNIRNGNVLLSANLKIINKDCWLFINFYRNEDNYFMHFLKSYGLLITSFFHEQKFLFIFY